MANQSAAVQKLAEGLWTIESGTIPYKVPPIPGTFPYQLRSVIVRLSDGSLWVDSPVELDDTLRGSIDELGPVRHIVSPNKLHHLFMGDWGAAYPQADLYASPGLTKKRPDLRFAKTLADAPEPAWADEIDQCCVGGSLFMHEVVFFHRRSRTLILGDLIENHDPELFNGWQRFWGRRYRMLAPNGETPLIFRMSFWDRSEARIGISRIFAWEPERVVVLHGPVVESGALRFLHNGFAWLGAISGAA